MMFALFGTSSYPTFLLTQKT